MNDINPPGIQLAAEANQLSVAPGGTLEVPIFIKNQSASADQVRITVEGIPLTWVSTDQPVILIQPGEQRRILLIVQPPAPPNANAGRYQMRITVTSTFDPQRRAEALLALSVAGFEVPGRVNVLLNGLQYTVTPGEKLAAPVIIFNQGLGPDTFQVEATGLPSGWWLINPSAWRLEAGEVANAILQIQPPRSSAARAGRYPFTILVKSAQAPEQNVSIPCTLTITAFTEIAARLYAPDPESETPARLALVNRSNTPAFVEVNWDSREQALAFDPPEPQQVKLGLDESHDLPYKAQPVSRYWVGNEKEHPYTVSVRSAGIEERILHGVVRQKAVMPPWAAALGALLVLLCCLAAGAGLLVSNGVMNRATATPALTATIAVTNTPMPTATQSRVDQRALLVDRSWFLVSFNNVISAPGTQEPFTRFNQDGSLIGFTGCKDFSGTYQTDLNRITIPSVNLSNGACPDQTLQVQEDMLLAILRSARSYLVADTTLQLSGDAGFLNYSLTPPQRPEEILPPQAVIQSPPQANVGEVVTFDGSQSSGQAALVSWRWEFGDGRTASGQIVQHAFNRQGTFAVKLTVTDQRGQTNTTNQQILITPLPTATPLPPTATIPAPPTDAPPPATDVPPPSPTPQPEIVPPQARINAPASGFIGEPVALDASGSRQGSSPIVSYTWSFGNGTGQPASPEAEISAIYNSTGMYEITVVVADANGQTSSASAVITINSRLDTRAWTLSTLNGQPLVPGAAITIQFLEGQLAGFAGCNDYSGRYTAVDNGDGTFALTIDSISTGRRACPPAIMDQENAFVNALQLISLAAVQENRLTLTGPDVQLIFFLISGP
jgi:heat shock protein HslJ